MITQKKLNTLTDIIKSIKSPGKRDYALSLIIDLVETINNQSQEFYVLASKKFNINPEKIEHEIEKYIWILVLYGYNQESIKMISNDTLEFLIKHKGELTRKPFFDDIFKIQNMFRSFVFENDREPQNLNELKEYINNAIRD